MKKVVVCSNHGWTIYNFRLGLIKDLTDEGYDVHVITKADSYTQKIKELGIKVHNWSLSRDGVNPLSELHSLYDLLKIVRYIAPCSMLFFTIKPVLYGSFVGRLLGIPVISTITGLGTIFDNKGLLRKLVEALYQLSLAKQDKIVFQNKDDIKLFNNTQIVGNERAVLVNGSGVNLTEFNYMPKEPTKDLVFVLVTRLLWTKGVKEYVEAARIISKESSNVKFLLVGPCGIKNPNAVGRTDIDRWVDQGIIDYKGETDDVRTYLELSDCVILPSFYREGIPRILIEAAAVGRPIITTDNVGCRETVDDGVNGYLCKPKSVADLVCKMRKFIALSSEVRGNMGWESRKKAEVLFDIEVVNKVYLNLLENEKS